MHSNYGLKGRRGWKCRKEACAVRTVSALVVVSWSTDSDTYSTAYYVNKAPMALKYSNRIQVTHNKEYDCDDRVRKRKGRDRPSEIRLATYCVVHAPLFLFSGEPSDQYSM